MKTLLLAVSLTVALAGCSSSGDSRPPPSASSNDIEVPTLDDVNATGDSRNRLKNGPCTDGEVLECRIYLPSHNDIQPCFVGEQLCVDSSWSECGNIVLVDANAGDEELVDSDLDN